jgi:hypothetical protein
MSVHMKVFKMTGGFKDSSSPINDKPNIFLFVNFACMSSEESINVNVLFS